MRAAERGSARVVEVKAEAEARRAALNHKREAALLALEERQVYCAVQYPTVPVTVLRCVAVLLSSRVLLYCTCIVVLYLYCCTVLRVLLYCTSKIQSWVPKASPLIIRCTVYPMYRWITVPVYYATPFVLRQ